MQHPDKIDLDLVQISTSNHKKGGCAQTTPFRFIRQTSWWNILSPHVLYIQFHDDFGPLIVIK